MIERVAMSSRGSPRRTAIGPRAADATLREVVSGIRGEVAFNARLAELTSFRIGGPADVLVVPADVEDVVNITRSCHRTKIPLFVVGGTNVLIRDGGIRGVVLSLSRLKAVREEPHGVLYAEGGAGMPAVLKHAISRSLSGLEWAAGIPGTVAGCVAMNAGTRLGEMKDAVKAVRLVRPTGRIVDLDASSIRFAYRRAHLPKGVIVGVRLQLKSGVQASIEKVVKEYLRYRKDTQPLTLPNAGCAFKNPLPDTAGRLIESAGLKGLRVGDAQVSEKHANFIVNVGSARAVHVIELVDRVRRTIREKFGIELDLELKIVGDP
jgi:UDP-N-acetylmuramate dehydrogenase